MISFLRKDNKVLVRISDGIIDGSRYFELELNQEYDYQAELLKNALRQNLEKHLFEIGRDAYLEGWKDAKAKRRKRTFFYGGW